MAESISKFIVRLTSPPSLRFDDFLFIFHKTCNLTSFLLKNMYLPTEMAEAISKFIVRLTSPPSLRAVHRYWPPSSTYKWIQMMGGVSKQDLYALHNGAKLFMKRAKLFQVNILPTNDGRC